MGSNPINLGLRFSLEIAGLIISGMWGWNQIDGWLSYLLAIGIPTTLAAIWGIFAVPNDPSRSSKAPVAIPGIIRLIIELGIFAFAIWALYDMGYYKVSLFFGIIITLHYFISYDRVIWLMSNKLGSVNRRM